MSGAIEPIVPDWPVPASVRAIVTTRQGGVSEGPYASLNLGMGSGDARASVEENRRRLRAMLPAEPVWMRQVHGTTVIDAATVAPGAAPAADAAWTRTPGVVCAVLAADCMPVLFADADGEAVGVAHAGWRGLCHGVLEACVAAMTRNPERLLAWLGPAIGPRAYEVGDEVRDAFLAADADAAAAFRAARPGHWWLDLYAIARQRLARCGVRRVHGGGACTHSEEQRYYSYRRDRVTGRMAALVWRA